MRSQNVASAKDYLQKFRSRRMCGYVAMYKEYEQHQMEDDIANSVDSMAAIIDTIGGSD